jgi:uncharacterized protein YyaL (SSP411 family)
MSEGPANRLAEASSPYLQLHAHNPVDWYPWGDEALARARVEDKPIFLSVGYSTCYWCHVMERESFTDPAIAELMNREFVNIKVDREERPDLDEIYMAATQVMTQQGGWPNSVFLTPDLLPFYAGTYFPPEDRHGRPGFPTVLMSLAAAWKERRGDIDAQAKELDGALRQVLEERTGLPGPTGSPVASGRLPGPEALDHSLLDLERSFDGTWGGFGSAPKFPTPGNLFLLLELADSQPQAARMLETTLDRMARGGIYDQLGGGFHRYATDREWKIPHFEKMLYDNGLLLEAYALEWRRSADPEAERVLRETAAFLARELTAPEGGFWSALDAETDGREGAFYAWRREQLREVLSEEEVGFLAPLYGFDGPPFFEGEYVLHLPRPLAEQAERRRKSRDELLAEIEPLRWRLFEARGARKRPLTDDKLLADWNGTAIAGLARAGEVLQDAGLVAQAARAAEFVLRTMRPSGGSLIHSWRAGRSGPAAFLSDYAFFVRGLLALERASGEGRWLEVATELASEQEDRLGDPAGGFFVAEVRDDLLYRSKEVFDGAMPGANSVAALNLVELAERTGESRWALAAQDCLRAFSNLVDSHPAAVRTMALVAGRLHRLTRDRADLFVEPSSPAPHGLESKVSASLEVDPPAEDGWRGFTLELEIEDGWHIYPPGTTAGLGGPTAVEGDGVELRELTFPRGVERSPVPTEPPLRIYEGRVVIRGELRSGADEGRLAVSFQPCGEQRCLAPSRIELRPSLGDR